jgi:hypothetical protein
MDENVEKFIAELGESLKNGTFVKMTLGNYKGTDEHLQKVHIRPIQTKKGERLFFLYRYDTRDTAKNYDFDTSVSLVDEMLEGQFFSGHLFTTQKDFQLDIGRKGRSRLNASKPSFKVPPPKQHDREKKHEIDRNAFYLSALGITTETHEVRAQQQDKWRQINKFVEVLASLVDKSPLKDKTELNIVDMGSGKGYLTFAAYDYFKNVRGADVTITGVEARDELVSLCNDIARASEFEKLEFVTGTIDSFDVTDVDILIALHACNTATDDALFKGITSKAGLIVAAPCCHKELRPQIKPPAMLKDILKHGVMLERTAETLTDGLRSLLLEREGYATKLFEFISVEHTPKNNMLVGTRLETSADRDRFQQEIDAIKETYGIREQHLETLLESREL